MKELVNKLITNLHIFLLFYGLWSAYGLYEEHTTIMEEIVNNGSGLDSEIGNLEKKVKEIQEFIRKSDEYKVRVEGVAKNIESVQRQLPSDTNDSQILSFFQNEINSLNLKDANIAPGKEEKSVYFISKEYTLSAKGTYLQFLIFLERIANSDRIYNIKTLKIKRNTENQKGRFQVVDSEGIIQAYRFNPEFKVDRGF